MRKLLVRLLINALALWAAASFIDGIHLSPSPVDVAIVALVFGLVNAVIKPVVFLLSLPFILLSLGLFTFVVNGLMLYLAAGLTSGLAVDGLGAAILGSLVVSIVSFALSLLLRDDD